jgi:hypothetical protein
MRLFCHFGWHRPSRKTIVNEGRTFSKCAGCGLDLVSTSQGWKTPPKGYKVLWKDKPRPKPGPEAASSTEKGPKRRKQPDRRISSGKDLPPYLGGKDRRRARTRRTGFGKKSD